ncbi:MraY family glycosyltransferase [Limnobacter sp. P1]|uniref:MraY family glycosyltransferase n=1 Tax=Limnobacter olei TaxID=3031298 RepID=UPI0023B0FDBF|nr:glycosyltransferase [Limnobacter sp. P1]
MQTIEVNPIYWLAILSSLAAAFSTAIFLVCTKQWHGAFSMDQAKGIQKFHTMPTPRVGGVALLAGAVASWFALPGHTLQGQETHELLGLVLLGGMPAFVAGLLEDITKKVSVKARLLATALSGLAFALLSGYWISGVNLPGVDYLLAWAPIGLLFTAFAISGIANSVNIIDGFNGLASGVVVLMLLTLAAIAWRVDDFVVLNIALCGVAVVLGFMLLNFPKGLIFLGDAGAYCLGYLVAALAVALTVRNPGAVSPWAMLLVCGYPIIETLFSVYRRLSRKCRRNPGTPDASHLHSLVYRRVVSRKLIPYAPAWQRNALTSPFMWLYAAVPMLGAIFWPQSLGMVVAWLALSFFVYQRAYRRMVRMGVFFRKPVRLAP